MDDLHALSALQGIVNRKRPSLYVNLVGHEGSIDRYWWGVLRRHGGWMERARTRPAADLPDLIRRFRGSLRGVVVWDERVPATSNVAATLAGVEDALPVSSTRTRVRSTLAWWSSPRASPAGGREALNRDGSPMFTMFGEGTIPGTRTPSTGSAKCDAYVWAVGRTIAKGRGQPRKMGYYPDAFWLGRPNGLPVDRTLLSNQDYFIAHRGFFFDLHSWDDEAPDDDPGQRLGTDVDTLRHILRVAWGRAKGR